MRLVQDQDRAVFGDHIDRASGLEIVQLIVNSPVIRSCGRKGLDVDHHYIDARVRGKAFQLMQPLGVIDERTQLLPVLLLEMLGRHLDRLGNAFADGDAGHHDDELRPAIPLVQLEHGTQVDIGLARAGLHLDVQVHPCAGVIAARLGFALVVHIGGQAFGQR